MKRIVIAEVIKAHKRTDLGAVRVTLDDGWEMDFAKPEDAPKVGDLVRIELAWGDDYVAPVMTMREASRRWATVE